MSWVSITSPMITNDASSQKYLGCVRISRTARIGLWNESAESESGIEEDACSRGIIRQNNPVPEFDMIVIILLHVTRLSSWPLCVIRRKLRIESCFENFSCTDKIISGCYEYTGL